MTCAGIATLSTVLWMRRHPRPSARSLPNPDLGRLHIAQALIYLFLAMALGLALVFMPEGPSSYRLAPIYGIAGLLGVSAHKVVQ